MNINAIDFGATFLPENQDRTLAPSATPGATAISNNLMRAYPGIRQHQPVLESRLAHVSLAPAVVPAPVPERPVVRLQRHDRPLRHGSRRASGCSTTPDGSYFIPRRSGRGRRLLGNNNPVRNVLRANFIWDLPDLKSSQSGAQGDRSRAERLADVRDLVGRARGANVRRATSTCRAAPTPSASTTRTAAATRT